MLIIRDQQMEVFDADINRRFVVDVLEDFKTDLPENYVTAEKESEMIDAGLEALSTAETKYELDDSYSLAAFMKMAWLYGAEFHLASETNAILTDESVNSRQKMTDVAQIKRA